MNGSKGERGERGLQGEQGLKGDRGESGPQGKEGPQGRQGPTGPQGFMGLIGPKGDRGDMGPQGERGANGKSGAPGVSGSPGKGVPSGGVQWDFLVKDSASPFATSFKSFEAFLTAYCATTYRSDADANAAGKRLYRAGFDHENASPNALIFTG